MSHVPQDVYSVSWMTRVKHSVEHQRTYTLYCRGYTGRSYWNGIRRSSTARSVDPALRLICHPAVHCRPPHRTERCTARTPANLMGAAPHPAPAVPRTRWVRSPNLHHPSAHRVDSPTPYPLRTYIGWCLEAAERFLPTQFNPPGAGVRSHPSRPSERSTPPSPPARAV